LVVRLTIAALLVRPKCRPTTIAALLVRPKCRPTTHQLLSATTGAPVMLERMTGTRRLSDPAKVLAHDKRRLSDPAQVLAHDALDVQLPEWHHRERHATPVTVPPGPTLAAFTALTWREVPVFRALVAVRSLGTFSSTAGRPILDDFTRTGFSPIVENPDEIVYAGIGRPWSVRGGMRPVETAQSFRDFAEPGWAKMAVNFRVADGVLSTETRVWLTDPGSRRAFGAYWLVIRPFSGLIRRAWLKAAARRAAGYPQGWRHADSPA
jgi:hypothetical protein